MARRGERKMDDFKFEIAGQKLSVPVTLVKGDYVGGVVGHSSTEDVWTFRATFEPAGFVEMNSDLNVLRETMLKKIKEWYSIEWSLFVMVKTTADSDRRGPVVRFGYMFYAIGKRPDGVEVYMEVPNPWDGADIFKGEEYRDKNGFWTGKWRTNCRYAGREPTVGRPKEGDDVDHWEHDTTQSLLPATVDTVNAILAFEMRLKELGNEMRKRFGPSLVRGTLENIIKAVPMPLALPAGPATPVVKDEEE